MLEAAPTRVRLQLGFVRWTWGFRCLCSPESPGDVGHLGVGSGFRVKPLLLICGPYLENTGPVRWSLYRSAFRACPGGVLQEPGTGGAVSGVDSDTVISLGLRWTEEEVPGGSSELEWKGCMTVSSPTAGGEVPERKDGQPGSCGQRKGFWRPRL